MQDISTKITERIINDEVNSRKMESQTDAKDYGNSVEIKAPNSRRPPLRKSTPRYRIRQFRWILPKPPIHCRRKKRESIPKYFIFGE